MRTFSANNCQSKTSKSGIILFLVICVFLLASQLVCAQECTLAIQLNDPYIRSDYQTVIDYWQKPQSAMTAEEMYGNIQNSSYSDELPTFTPDSGSRILDPISMECITCHDGTLAGSIHYKVSSMDQGEGRSVGSINGSHPVGTDYSRYISKREYVPSYNLPRNMILMNGKISCVTCHDMLSRNQAYLVVDMTSSNLCFACHRK